MSFDKLLTDFKDYHVPICTGVFVVGSVLQYLHHMDMAFVAFTGTVLGALVGHAYSPAGKPDGQ